MTYNEKVTKCYKENTELHKWLTNGYNRTMVMLHSKKDIGYAYYYGQYLDNSYIFYTENGFFCTAIYNGFVGRYYVDDIYGILTSIEAANDLICNYENEIPDWIRYVEENFLNSNVESV